MTRSQSYVRASLRLLGAFFVVGSFAAAGAGCAGPEYPNCDNDEQCHEGEFCVNGQCQQCRDDSDCPAGQSCESGRCEPIPGWCGSNADCPEGQVCENNRCVTPIQATEELPQQAGCSMSAVYFAYDSSELDGTTRTTIEQNASCIQERDIPQVTLTGHADPRGTEEYNLALGERRAQSVQGHLQRLGVDRGRTTVRSMGEEMARGSDESSWGQDRRVEFEER